MESFGMDENGARGSKSVIVITVTASAVLTADLEIARPLAKGCTDHQSLLTLFVTGGARHDARVQIPPLRDLKLEPKQRVG
jgi:hypothetical protein